MACSQVDHRLVVRNRDTLSMYEPLAPSPGHILAQEIAVAITLPFLNIRWRHLFQ